MQNLTTIVQISKEVISVVEEMMPLIAKAPVNDSGLQGLLYECIFLCKRLSFLDTVNLNEFAQNNYEFLDVIKTIILRVSGCHENESLETQEKLRSLIVRIDIIVDKLNAPPFPQNYSLRTSDKFLQRKKSDEDFTEPFNFRFL
jgi:hypothetical protein